ncbi:907_t:CDS:2 [Acaulospora morrowiae]|uniref:907_t:CDS:1 n=1 Tax=Acaulospora morrowiae TaxID=94023 RepID=A0A9N8ZQ28_9GLOM|nr:907_t:CDS:2 [Acaulospora morrowiae]
MGGENHPRRGKMNKVYPSGVKRLGTNSPLNLNIRGATYVRRVLWRTYCPLFSNDDSARNIDDTLDASLSAVDVMSPALKVIAIRMNAG